MTAPDAEQRHGLYKHDRWSVEDRGYETPCWVWKLHKEHGGYGQLMADGRVQRAHRYYYEQTKGPIPDGMEIDHLCRVIDCVNPGHLEAVPPIENWRRSEAPSAKNARKTHCIHGHEFTPENTRLASNGWRICRTCVRERQRDYRRAIP